MREYDLIVIGGGPAGYTAALRAAKLGSSVALIEKDFLGGTCLNRGCVPTKTLLETAAAAELFASAEAFALEVSSTCVVDRKKLIRRKNAVIERLRSGLQAMIQSSGIEIISEIGKLTAQGSVLIEAENSYEIQGKKVIIATGSGEAKPRIKGSQHMIGSSEALELSWIPEEICVIGGGVVGVELATFYRGIGCETHILEALPHVLANVDTEIRTMAQQDLEKKGIQIHTNSFVKEIEKTSHGFVVSYEEGECGQEKEIRTKAVLNAVGRVPNTKGLGLENWDIACDEKGFVKVDKYLRTSSDRVYAAGDVIGRQLLAHTAFEEGRAAAENAIKGDHIVSGNKAVPQCVYTHPEIAAAGMTEQEAVNQGIRVKKGTFQLAANGRSLAKGMDRGMVKVIADDTLGQLLGVQIYGEMASEVIGTAVIAIDGEYTCEEFCQLIIAHPTVTEALKDAVSNCV